MSEQESARPVGVSAAMLFAWPFRIFFLSLAVWAVLAVAFWVPQISKGVDWPLALAPLAWHQHEMLFGFLNAAIAGFLLTAVCVWTGTDRLHGPLLLGLWLVWLAGRLAMTLGEALPLSLVHAINLAFLPLVALDAGWRVWRARQPRHVPVLVVLGLIWLMQAGFLLADPARYHAGALVAILALMLIIGGRITPAFSAGWLRRQGRDASDIRVLPKLEWTMLAVLLLLLVAVVAEQRVAVTFLALAAGLITLVRIGLWRGWKVASDPLLWILHLSLLWIPVALLLLAGAEAGWWAATIWKHAAGAGAMGGLILGVIARVALGHTGRLLILPAGMATAFVLVHLGALVRVLSGMEWLPWQPALWFSAGCWIVSYGLFLWHYTGILTGPRVDGRPG